MAMHPTLTQIKSTLTQFKPYLRWLVLGGTLFFLASTLRQHWAGVVSLRVEPIAWAILLVALGVTLLAHIWSGWVWSWILRELDQPVGGVWGILVYLKTNIAKYLPGNVWHFYGRVMAAKQAGCSVGVATLSVLLEALLMAAAALTLALFGLQSQFQPLQILGLIAVLGGIHPRILNPLLQLASQIKGKKPIASDLDLGSESTPESTAQPVQIRRYLVIPLLGEFAFVLLRGVGFLLTVLALNSVGLAQVPLLLSAFGIAWLLGLVVPGAPGGIGVFEATAVALLENQFPAASILGSVALYRLVSTLAEAIGAGLAKLEERL